MLSQVFTNHKLYRNRKDETMANKSKEAQAAHLENEIYARKQVVKLHLTKIGKRLNEAISITPTGKAREALTDINILRMELEKKLEELW